MLTQSIEKTNTGLACVEKMIGGGLVCLHKFQEVLYFHLIISSDC